MAGPHGRVSSMEHTASCRERPTSTCLTDVYRCFQTGSCPSHSAAEAADEIFSMILPGEDGQCAPAGYYHDNRSELTYISLTLVEKIISSLTSRSLPPPVALYCADIQRILFQDMDLMSQLVSAPLSSCSVKNSSYISMTLKKPSTPQVCQFHAEDQIISHLAAKSVSAWVFYHLLQSVSFQFWTPTFLKYCRLFIQVRFTTF